MTAKAGAPFQIEFENKDAGTPAQRLHPRGLADRHRGLPGQIFNGVATKDYDVTALDAGTYSFVCTVHPTMIGTLTVQ